MVNHTDFSFKELTVDYEPLVLSWLKMPHVNEWFHGVGLENTIQGIRSYLEGKRLNHKGYVLFFKEVPFAYIMVNQLTKDDYVSPTSFYKKWIEKDFQYITMDLFIGDKEYLGRGLASPMISVFIATHCADVKGIFIDPESTNHKAIHVYEKVGFQKIDSFIAPWHPVPHTLMLKTVSQ